MLRKIIYIAFISLMTASAFANESSRNILKMIPEGEHEGVGVNYFGEEDACWLGVESFGHKAAGIYISFGPTLDGERDETNLDFNYSGGQDANFKMTKTDLYLEKITKDANRRPMTEKLTIKKLKNGGVKVSIESISKGILWGTNSHKSSCIVEEFSRD